MSVSKSTSATAGTCTYIKCQRPAGSSQIFTIEKSTSAGGHDWTPLIGQSLCTACFYRYKRRGTLEKSVRFPLPEGERKCMYEGCDRPDRSIKFYHIEAGRKTGGHDWGPLANNILCKACYERFRRSGSLERAYSKPLAASAKKCTYPGCERPGQSKKWIQIEEGHPRKAGGQDWTPLVGSVLCYACFCRYMKRGTLARTMNKPIPTAEKFCAYEHCDRPERGTKFHYIEEGKRAGGQDWGTHTGKILCDSCYERFRTRGTLERSGSKTPIPQVSRQCVYEGCDRQKGSSFHLVERGKKSGERDWGALVGKVLCGACYQRFKRSGTLDKHDRPALAGACKGVPDKTGVLEGVLPVGVGKREKGRLGADLKEQEDEDVEGNKEKKEEEIDYDDDEEEDEDVEEEEKDREEVVSHGSGPIPSNALLNGTGLKPRSRGVSVGQAGRTLSGRVPKPTVKVQLQAEEHVHTTSKVKRKRAEEHVCTTSKVKRKRVRGEEEGEGEGEGEGAGGRRRQPRGSGLGEVGGFGRAKGLRQWGRDKVAKGVKREELGVAVREEEERGADRGEGGGVNEGEQEEDEEEEEEEEIHCADGAGGALDLLCAVSSMFGTQHP